MTVLRKAGLLGLLLCILCLFGGCTGIGDKSLSLTVIYGVTSVAAWLLLFVCIALTKRREPCLPVLFACIATVNTGYCALSLATTLDTALSANSIAYLGSVFLPPAMLMIILRVSRLSYRRVLPVLLIIAALVMFCITLTPLYYTSASLSTVSGSTTLIKEYGPLHAVYPVYLFTYFAAMIAAVVQAIRKKQRQSPAFSVLLASAVFINIGVWLLEQLAEIHFELLSVSYIISELFLLGLFWMTQVYPAPEAATSSVTPEEPSAPLPDDSLKQRAADLQAQLPSLTRTERAVFDLYVQGKGTKEVLEELSIKENTLKYHNRNLYSKLGVRSRKELVRLASCITEDV